MALYKLIEVKKTAEAETQSIYDRDDVNIAVNDMHDDFGSAVKTDGTIGAIAVVIDNTTGLLVDRLEWGEPVKNRVYTHNNYANDTLAAYDTEQLAIGNYHTKLASQRKKSECTFALTIRLDSHGAYGDFNLWQRE